MLKSDRRLQWRDLVLGTGDAMSVVAVAAFELVFSVSQT